MGGVPKDEDPGCLPDKVQGEGDEMGREGVEGEPQLGRKDLDRVRQETPPRRRLDQLRAATLGLALAITLTAPFPLTLTRLLGGAVGHVAVLFVLLPAAAQAGGEQAEEVLLWHVG